MGERPSRYYKTMDLEFSIQAPNAAGIQPLMDEFRAETGIRVRLRLLSWDTAWSDLIKVALYGDGPDVSEIGSTWIGDLVAMTALRAFDAQNISALGGASYFLPTSWR
jgi:multiple sugar transport system substrate-binding protein